MKFLRSKTGLYPLAFFKYDFRASITVFFVALPLCLGISLASGTPVYAGLVAGILGGIIVPLISKSALSVSGPAAGLTAICAMAITQLGSIKIFFLSVAVAGLLQVLLGLFKLGGFTHFIPSSVIKGMLAAIGIILITKQLPLLIGYDKPDFWEEEPLNLLTFHHGLERLRTASQRVSTGAILIALLSLFFLISWKKWMAHRFSFLPTSFVTVILGALLAYAFQIYLPEKRLDPSQFVTLPALTVDEIKIPELSTLFNNRAMWETAVVICFVAALETLLSVEAIDNLDPNNRVTPQNRELIAQGVANFASGMVGGIPITAVIVRSAANAEAGAKTRLSAMLHGLWLLLTVMFAAPLTRHIPYCVLAVILIRTGYNLARPAMIMGVYKQGREQFLPFIATIVTILATDLLIGVLIGIGFAIYFLVKHTYRAGYSLKEKLEGMTKHFHIELALNVSFLNKKRFLELLERIPERSVVVINGAHSIYIDNDILEIFHAFKTKAITRNIQLTMISIPEAAVVKMH